MMMEAYPPLLHRNKNARGCNSKESCLPACQRAEAMNQINSKIQNSIPGKNVVTTLKIRARKILSDEKEKAISS